MAELLQLFDTEQYKRPDMNGDLRLGFASNDFSGSKWKTDGDRPVERLGGVQALPGPAARWKPGRPSAGRRLLTPADEPSRPSTRIPAPASAA